MLDRLTRLECLTPTFVCLAALSFAGCTQSQTGTVMRSDIMLTVGGIFWPAVTPGYTTETSGTATLSIPKGSVCDIRHHPGAGSGRAMVKVRVNDQWHILWVNHVLSQDHEGLQFLPFETFPYISHGSEAEPDRNWGETCASLLKAADESMLEMSDDSLRQEYGDRTVEALSGPTTGLSAPRSPRSSE